jgi:hypothetical protein
MNWEKSFLAAGVIAVANGDNSGSDGSVPQASVKIEMDGALVDITSEIGTLVPLEQTVHEIIVSDQVLLLNPPLEQARCEWIGYYKSYISAVTTLPRLVLSRYAVFASSNADGPATYSNIAAKIDRSVLRRPYMAIEKMLGKARKCVNNWLQYQALWDSSVTEVCARLGKDIAKWQRLLTEIKAARSGIDLVEQEIAFGPVVVNFRQVWFPLSTR